MNLQTALRAEHLPALVAPVVLDARVRLEVRGEGGLDAEGLEAVAALEWLLVRVYTYVTREIARFLKLLTAVQTLVPARSINLHRGAVLLQFKFRYRYFSVIGGRKPKIQ